MCELHPIRTLAHISKIVGRSHLADIQRSVRANPSNQLHILTLNSACFLRHLISLFFSYSFSSLTSRSEIASRRRSAFEVGNDTVEANDNDDGMIGDTDAEGTDSETDNAVEGDGAKSFGLV